MTTVNTTDRILDVLIATHGDDGLRRVAEMTLPSVSGVKYIVTWQTTAGGDIPAELMRNDVEIHEISTTGSSNNHNAGIELLRAPYCLFADNDLNYTTEGLVAVINSLDSHPEIDVATFRHSGEPVYYPDKETDFSEKMPKGYSVATYDIAARSKSIQNIRFDPNFGVAARLRQPRTHYSYLTAGVQDLNADSSRLRLWSMRDFQPATGQLTIRV